ncbi:uncharacterized protein V6R79_003358 [Siganus canaliculatus]
MASLKSVFYLGLCLSTWTIATTDESDAPKAENVHWVSLDFKTILKWTVGETDYKFTVRYSEDKGDWKDSHYCIQVSDSECDMTYDLEPLDRVYTADVQTEPLDSDYDNLEDFPHTYSPEFNPYRQSNISDVKFTVEAVDSSRVTVNITDPLTSIHVGNKQLSIRDILRNDLKYKISYSKSGSTGKRDIITNSSVAEVSKLDPGSSYCFMVAAFIPSRTTNQLGAWSMQLCTPDDSNRLSLGAWVGIVFILLTAIIIIVTVTVLCRQRKRSPYPSQQSSPI